jgi:hypothetical protein
MVCPDIKIMNQQVTKRYRVGETTAAELYFLEKSRWLLTCDFSYWYHHKINIESVVSRTKNIYGVLDIFCRIAGVNKDSLHWFTVAEKDWGGLGNWHHHMCIGPYGLEPKSPFQMKLLSDCWQNFYRPKWYEDWLNRTRSMPNRERNKVLRERYRYFQSDLDTYLGKDHKSPIAFNILDEHTFGGDERSKSPYNGMGQALIQLYNEDKFWNTGVGYRCKRPVDPETGQPKVDSEHPVYVDMSPKLFRYWKSKQQNVIPEIDHRQKFFSKKDPGALHPFKLYNIIPSNSGFDLRLIGLSGAQFLYQL